jgi:hypothetical protein
MPTIEPALGTSTPAVGQGVGIGVLGRRHLDLSQKREEHRTGVFCGGRDLGFVGEPADAVVQHGLGGC